MSDGRPPEIHPIRLAMGLLAVSIGIAAGALVVLIVIMFVIAYLVGLHVSVT